MTDSKAYGEASKSPFDEWIESNIQQLLDRNSYSPETSDWGDEDTTKLVMEGFRHAIEVLKEFSIRYEEDQDYTGAIAELEHYLKAPKNAVNKMDKL